MVKIKTIDLSELALDYKLGLKDYSVLFGEGIRLKNILKHSSIERDIKSGRTPSRFEPNYWNGEHEFLTMEDIDGYELKPQTKHRVTDVAIGEDQTLFQAPKDGLLISNAMTIGLSIILNRPVFINQNIFYIDLDEKKINKKWLSHYFNSVLRKSFQKTYYSKYLSKAELGNIKIPPISLELQKTVVNRIKEIEREIKILKSDPLDPEEVINEVFVEEFDFDLNDIADAKKERVFNTTIREYGKNNDFRFSFRFHSAAGRMASDILRSFTKKKIKDYINEPIRLGAGISPKFYDENGPAYYLTMATIKNWQYQTEDAKKVSYEYWKKEKDNNSIRQNDIIIARSGEGTIGKVAIIKNDSDTSIFCDFTMRVSFSNYNPLFAYYYFRTDLFQTLIEKNKKGLGNNTNIFPNQIKEFPIPDINQDRQQSIADKISFRINIIQNKKRDIEQKYKEIDQIIESSLDSKKRTKSFVPY